MEDKSNELKNTSPDRQNDSVYGYGSFAPAKKTAAAVKPENKTDSRKEKKARKAVLKEEQRLKKIAAKKAKMKKKQKQKKAAQEESYSGFGSSLQNSYDRYEPKDLKVTNPLGRKLILIISFLFIVALGAVTYLVSFFVSQDVKISAEENNLVMNSRTAGDFENRIKNISSSMGMLLDLLKNTTESETEIIAAETMFFDHNKEIIGVYMPLTDRRFYNAAYLISNSIDRDSVDAYFSQENDRLQSAESGTFELENASPFFSKPVLAIFHPLTMNGKKTAIGILYSSDALSEILSMGTVNQSFIINNEGEVLVHGDLNLLSKGENFKNLKIVQEMQKSTQNNAQITYNEKDGEEYIGAFRKIKIGNGGVITTVKTSIIYEGVRRTTRRNIYISAAILFLTLMVVYFFSQSLSVALKKLTVVVNEINKGNFNTELFGILNDKSKDEIGVLAKSTKNEREILNTFTTLTNKGVTEAIIKKQIDFTPHLKDITIFFSDIRGFTAISDGFKNRFGEKSAAEIIGFLNDYMSRMVTCIQLTGGIVDKFEGDAIMACWGVLRNSSLDWEMLDPDMPYYKEKKAAHDKYVREDAIRAVTCCIAMRYSLMKYNKDAEAFTKKHENEPHAKYKPHIRIGSGLNSGRATVGFLGSQHKMEFTSIGDAVNFASRTEASNKLCGTDILITQDTYDILAKKYIRCEKNGWFIKPENLKYEIVVEQIPVEFEVTGNGKQHFYGVVNMPQFDIEKFFKHGIPDFKLDMDCAKAAGYYGPKTISDVRKLLGIPEPDFGKVNLDEEENKIQVATS